jgi:chromosome segregation ATPase
VSAADSDEHEPPALSAAADELYRTDPAEFVAARTTLARDARKSGDAELAKRITGLRKPTVAAWIVNRYVLANPEIVQRLGELNERLQAAHADLDAAVLRELTTERRGTVDELTRAALEAAENADAATSLREEVSATFDAALADPEVAGRLGRLHRAEHWSGFGVASGDLPAGSPALRLLRGGRAGQQKAGARAPAAISPEDAAEKPAKATSAKSAAERKAARDQERALRSAQQAFTKAETELGDARSAEQAARERVRTLSEQLSDVQRRLTEAKAALDERHRAVKAAQTRHREARSALSRAERNAAR